MGGFAFLPDGGGYNDQCAWLMDAFDIIGDGVAKLRAIEG